ncbi:MAG TPA: hypothetical protein VJ770_12210 [Stellaceae bacterium]|nr:hypothetical protein [Stellaceae bacterium]
MSGDDVFYSGTYANGIVLGNPATQNPATIAAAGLVTNNGTALYGQPVAAWSINNFGTIDGEAGIGIALAAGGTIANAGLIEGDPAGILINGGAGTVVNSGSIASAVSLNAGGSVTNDSSGTIGRVFIANGAGTVANSGTIDGSVILTAGGSVENASGGDISGPLPDSFGHVLPALSISGGAGTVINSGNIQGAVVLNAGGSVTNDSGGRTGSVSIANGGTIVNSGSIGGVFLGAGGSVTNNLIGSEDGISISGGAGTVANSGLIKGSVNLDGGGTVTNLGVIGVASGNFEGYRGAHNAVAFYASGTLTNLGTIKAGNLKTGPGSVGVALADGGTIDNGASGSPLALISGSYFGVLGYGGSTIVNFGRIKSTGSYGTGVYLGPDGMMTNSGIITGYEYGAAILGRAGTLVNDGAISAAGSSGVGVTLGGDNSTLVNAGFIAGTSGTAVSLAGGYNDLVVQPEAVFAGKVEAVGSYDTLELAGSRGRLAGLGTGFSGFYNLAVDPGALWNLSGPGAALAVDNDGTLVVKGDTLALGSIISDAGDKGAIRIAAEGTATFTGVVGAHEHVAFTSGTGTMQLDRPLSFKGAITGLRAGDTIDLVDQAADAVNFAGHRLTVTDSGAAVADLHLFGTFTSADFALSPDGHGGTDITLLTPDILAMKA